jgi:hypothetical protein
LNIFISDQAEEFRIEISGRFAEAAVSEAGTAWKAALSANTPRRISVDITQMTGYDRAGYLLLREIYSHGTHIVAGTPSSLLHLSQISSSKPMLASIFDEPAKSKRKPLVALQPRATASGE